MLAEHVDPAKQNNVVDLKPAFGNRIEFKYATIIPPCRGI